MFRSYHMIAVLVLLGLATAGAQTNNSSPLGQNGQNPQPRVQAPAANAPSTSPAATPNNVPASAPSSSTQVTTSGGLAGTASSTSPVTPDTADFPDNMGAPSDSDLQSQLRNALSKEPTLSHNSVNATVTAEAIELSGNVTTGREKQTATRIAQSFALNKKVVSHITVSAAAPAPAAQPQARSATEGKREGESGSRKSSGTPGSKSNSSPPNPPLN